MLDYQTTMTIGAGRYQDVLDVLREAGLDATFTQTGGMNAALEVMLDGGWGVALYPPDQANTDGECLAFDSTDDGSARGLPELAWQVLRNYTRNAQQP